ncbi:fungal specific transcription factor domain-containing protein [Trichoderma breve]|uniref:Fungal specific transcription factor domain-containing protein n=1 Tax=Trichoderma breve TaxID=2034170 RepID=A0A9W9E5D3_9HYPO|nr:fungal specific transcription factor domain-containing protein [Trichoderma breve]KAJ4857212.1 fungal specific transcription factor domain-containing protein [Trichoderma breve]
MKSPTIGNQHSSKRKRLVTSCSECYRRKQRCNRKNPCNNCLARNIPNKCMFSTSPQHTPARVQQLPVSTVSTIQVSTGTAQSSGIGGESTQDSVDLGYSLVSGDNSFVGLQELPSRSVIEALVDFFFDEVNWHYFILERLYFNDIFSRWPPKERTEPVKYLKSTQLSMELRYFPSLLFQVIALAVQFLPPDWDVLPEPSLRGLASSRTYSDLGDELLYFLRRPGLALAAVQADFLRSSWLKNYGRGVESWHAVGNSISRRQAQELGLHRQREIYQSRDTNVEETLSMFWYEQHKKRIWINLFVWDGYMAMLLGRPRMIHMDDCDVEPPMDCNIPGDPSTAVPMTVRPEDSQSISTASAPLYRYAMACKAHEMRALRADRPHLKDYSIVRTLHDEIMSLVEALPAFLRVKNPDTTRDADIPYLPQLRQEVQVMTNLFLMTLHRPHIISNLESRRAALQAALETLDSQQSFFAHAKQHQYQLFGFAFYTVDASFLVSIITILFPPQNSETRQKISHSLHQAIESLSIMQTSNAIAASGLDIIQRCYQKLKSSPESSSSISDARTPSYYTPSNTISGLASSTPLPQPTLDNFNQTYWLDQLNAIDPLIYDQDFGNLWENINFD